MARGKPWFVRLPKRGGDVTMGYGGNLMSQQSKKALIFIVAYNAEKTITSVLGRIPVDKLPAGTEVLVIDDSSSDRTFRMAQDNRDKVAGLNITILYNPVNQGYGGNQKLGYQYAIEHGFDVVALLHGDGQYAPEKLPELMAPVLAGEADACFGSRMMAGGAPLKGGMPLYKFAGNRILSRFQNAVLGMNLSEFHSGYRVYSVDALRKIPFQCNTNDFHFDTEIIIQLALGQLRIKEVPIPTYYGGEICYVNGLAYAWNVVKTTIMSRLHLAGMLFQRKFDVGRKADVYGIKLGYPSSHTYAIGAVKDGSKVLDLGCGPGYVAEELRRKGCHVTGMDKVEQEASRFDKFVKHDLDSEYLPIQLERYDYILALDCLEHLDSPERLVRLVRERLYSDKTALIVTVPNIGFFVNRFGLLFGQFNYGASGILDLTHRRLFTFGTLRRFLQQEGFVIKKLRGIPAPFPKALGKGIPGRVFLGVNRCLIRLWRGMFSYQIYAEAAMTPTVNDLLGRTLSFSERYSGNRTDQ